MTITAEHAETETAEVANLRTFRVDETNLETARAMVAKVNARAARYGLAQYELVVGELELVPVHVEGLPIPVRYQGVYPVELVGEQPRIAGWSFVATLDYEEVETDGDGRVITRVVPGVDVDLAAHRPRPAECDACGKRRARNNTYVLRNEAGQTMQVGSNCIQPYMGLDVRGLAWLAGDPLAELGELAEEREQTGSGSWGGTRRYDVDAVLVATMAVEQVHGWVSRAVAQEYGKTATSSWVRLVLDGARNDRDRADLARMVEAWDMPAAEVKAAAVREWAATQAEGGEWAENVRTCATGTTVSSGNVGVLASAVAGYNRAQQEQAKRAEIVPATYVGTVGKREVFTGEVVFTLPMAGDYGTRELVLVRTDDGGLLKWIASSVTEFKKGDRVTGKATVKAHAEYRGDKQTVIQRAAFAKLPA